MDQFYYDSGYVDASYFVYTAEADLSALASASISCDASVIAGGGIVEASGAWVVDGGITASAGKIADGQSQLVLEFTQQATISHIEGADLFAFTEAALAAQVDRIRDNNIEITSAFTQVTAGSKFIHFSSDQNIETSITADNLRVRFSEAAVDAAFSLAATIELVKVSAVSIESQTSISISADKVANAEIACASEFALVSDTTKIKLAQASLSSQFSITPTAFISNKRPRQTTVSGNMQIVNTQYRVGTHSLYKGSTSASLSVAKTKDFNIAADENFNIEFFLKRNGWTTNGNTTILELTADGYGDTLLRFRVAGVYDAITVDFFDSVNNQLLTINSGTAGALDWYQWNYIRLRRINGNTIELIRGGTVVGSYAYSGAIRDRNGVSLTTLKFGTAGSSFTGWFDEFYFAKGTTSGGQSDPATPVLLTSGAEPTTQALFHWDGNYLDDINGVVQFQAALTSQSTISATATEVTSLNATISAQASLASAPVKTTSTSIALASNGAQVTVNARIRSDVADLDAVSQLSAVANRSASLEASISSQASLSSTAIKINPGSATLDASSQLTASPVVTRSANSATSSQADLTSQLNTIYSAVIDAQALFTPAIDCSVTTSNDIPLSATTALAALVVAQRTTAVTVNTTASLAVDAEIFSDNASDMIAIVNFNADGNRLRATSVELTSQATVSAQAQLTATAVIDLSVSTQVTIDANRYRDNPAALNSLFSLTADDSYLVQGQLDLTTTVALTANAVKTAQALTAFESIASELTAAAKTGNGLVTIETTSALACTAGTIKQYNKGIGGSNGLVQLTNPTIDATESVDIFGTAFSDYQVQVGTWISFWARKSYPEELYQVYVSNSKSNNSIKFINRNGDFRIEADDGTGTSGDAHYRMTWLDAVPNDQEWHHFALYALSYTSAPGTNFSWNLWIDGTSQGSKSISSPVGNESLIPYGLNSYIFSPIDVGSTNGNMAQLWWGDITGGTPSQVPDVFYNNGFVEIPTTGIVNSWTPWYYSTLDSAIDYPLQGIASVTSLGIQAEIKVVVAANLTATSAVNADAINIPFAEAELSITASLTAVGQLTRTTSAAMQSSATMVTDVAQQTIEASADLAANTSIEANNQRVRYNASSMQTQASLTTSSKRTVSAQANLQAFDFVIVAGRTISLDPFYRLVIKSETRALPVLSESRGLLIASETRVNKIKGYPI